VLSATEGQLAFLFEIFAFFKAKEFGRITGASA